MTMSDTTNAWGWVNNTNHYWCNKYYYYYKINDDDSINFNFQKINKGFNGSTNYLKNVFLNSLL